MKEKDKETFVLPERVTIENVSPIFKEIKKQQKKSSIEIDCSRVKKFDSAAIALLNHIKQNFPSIIIDKISSELKLLIDTSAPLEQEASKKPKPQTIGKRLEFIADKYITIKKQIRTYLVLLADEIFYTIQYIFKRRGVYPGEILNQLFFMGYKSFPIITLISLLVGVTTSIISLEQLRNYGADIYIADLVGYGLVVEMVPLISGIIMAGKIGASITAEISSMKVLEEIDALKTMGIVPERFLMVPRLIAITLAVPLLVTIADFIGIWAGIIVARLVSDIQPKMFLTEMFTVVKTWEFSVGLIKTLVFGWIVVITSGYKGFTVKKGAVGVGIATTQSVVLSISLIIVWDCIFAMILYQT